ncbi:MAG: hypothetical protein DSY83_05815, partial [Flavobacteriia bacterium]
GQNATDCQNKVALEGTWRMASANLSLVSACSLQNTDIEFNVNGTEFYICVLQTTCADQAQIR